MTAGHVPEWRDVAALRDWLVEHIAGRPYGPREAILGQIDGSARLPRRAARVLTEQEGGPPNERWERAGDDEPRELSCACGFPSAPYRHHSLNSGRSCEEYERAGGGDTAGQDEPASGDAEQVSAELSAATREQGNAAPAVDTAAPGQPTVRIDRVMERPTPTRPARRTRPMAETKRYSLIVCLHCTEDTGDPWVIPFGGDTDDEAIKKARAWWKAHRAGTGHTWAWRNPDGEQPGPDEAARQARDYMAENEPWAPKREQPGGDR